MENYIKISRKILTWEWYNDINTKTLFLHFLLKANWQDSEWHGKMVKRGSLISSYSILAEETGLSVREIRTSIKHLETSGEIEVITTNRYSQITIIHYSDYQGEDIAKKDEKNIPVLLFDKFWEVYPRRENSSRVAAEKEYTRLLSEGLSEDDLVTAAGNYADACIKLGTELTYIKLPDNFLKDRKFSSYMPGEYHSPERQKGSAGKSQLEQYNSFMQRDDYNYNELEETLLNN